MRESVYRQFVADLVALAERPKAELREEIIAYVQHAYAAGELWAAQVLDRWERAGADSDYTAAYKSLNSVTYIRRDGSRVRKTTAYSRPVRSPKAAVWSYSRNELLLWHQDIIRQADQLADVVSAGYQYIAAMDRHPECATLREAWLADGRSLAEIDLTGTGRAS